MNKTAKVAARTKPVKKASAMAAKHAKKAAALSSKPMKKRPKALSAAKAVRDGADEWKPVAVPLAEVEVLAAKAVKMIKAKRSASAAEKAKRLEQVAEVLEFARRRGAVSKCGAWGLLHPFGLGIIVHDWPEVM